MAGSRVAGHALIFIGTVVLLFTVYLGYIFFNSDIYNASHSPASQQAAASGILGLLSTPVISSFVYFIIAIVIMAIIISIGAKLIGNGIKVLALPDSDRSEGRTKRKRDMEDV